MPRPTGSCTKAGAPGSLPWGGCGAPSVIPTRQWNSPILFFSIITNIILLSPFSKPEFLKEDLFLGFVLIVVGIFTVSFGFIGGITGATIEGIFIEWKTKL